MTNETEMGRNEPESSPVDATPARRVRCLYVGSAVGLRWRLRDGWTEMPGAIHLGRNQWMIPLEKEAPDA